MNFKILGEHVTKNKFGSKAFWINWLFKNGYKVPKSIFFTHSVEKEFLYNNLSEIMKMNNFVSNKYAIRSSSTIEDSFVESKAGYFKTYLGEMSFEEILSNYCRVKDSQRIDLKGNMGVIIQELVDPLISGVIFSSNPTNYSKDEVLISYTHGLADKLVSGRHSSIDLIATIENDLINLSANNMQYDSQILSLVKKVKQIESILDFPVDVEWALDKKGELIFLQCRPITKFLLQKNSINKVTEKEMNNISVNLTSSDKVKLRILSEKSNIFISKAYLITLNCGKNECVLPNLNIVQRSEFCKGYSVVIISPKTIRQKVIRAFVGERNNVTKLVKCHRYGVRAVSDYENIKSCIEQFAELAKQHFWVCSIIIQEIFDPIYTGILSKKQSNYIIELAKGHFVSKGIVPMTRYIVEKNKIIFSDEVEQEKYISIIEGCTLEFYCGYESRYNSLIVSLSENELLKIIDAFLKIDEENVMVEFGVLEHNNTTIPYLIDIVKEDVVIDIDDIKNGILCHGKLGGRIIKLKTESSDSLNLHYFNEINVKNRSDEKIVFVAKLPDISFMNLLSEFNPENISFIFEGGSVLCHFAILLREKRIPSLVGYNINNLKEGEFFELII